MARVPALSEDHQTDQQRPALITRCFCPAQSHRGKHASTRAFRPFRRTSSTDRPWKIKRKSGAEQESGPASVRDRIVAPPDPPVRSLATAVDQVTPVLRIGAISSPGATVDRCGSAQPSELSLLPRPGSTEAVPLDIILKEAGFELVSFESATGGAALAVEGTADRWAVVLSTLRSFLGRRGRPARRLPCRSTGHGRGLVPTPVGRARSGRHH